MTYDECEPKRLGRHVVLERKNAHTFCVRYYDTSVVEIHEDGTYTIRAGHWRTKSTKSIINQYSPAWIKQKDFQWYLDGEEFEDGMRVDQNGKLVAQKVGL